MRKIIVSIQREMEVNDADFEYLKDLVENGNLTYFEYETDLTAEGAPTIKEVVAKKKKKTSRKKSKK